MLIPSACLTAVLVLEQNLFIKSIFDSLKATQTLSFCLLKLPFILFILFDEDVEDAQAFERPKKKKQRSRAPSPPASDQDSGSEEEESFIQPSKQVQRPRDNRPRGKEFNSRVLQKISKNQEMPPRMSKNSKRAAASAPPNAPETSPPEPKKSKPNEGNQVAGTGGTDKDALILQLQQQLNSLKSGAEKPAEKENSQPQKSVSVAVAAKPATNTSWKPLSKIAVPTGYQDEVFAYVKQEIWRDVKFLATEEEVLCVCKVLIKEMPQFSDLRSENPAQLEANAKAIEEVYGQIVLSAINQRRTDVNSLLRKAYIAYALKNDGDVPDAATIKKVAYRKDLQEVEVPEITLKKPEEGATEEEIQAYQDEIAKVEKAQKYNKEVAYNWGVFRWYWEVLLLQVCSKHRWGPNFRHFFTISGGTVRKDPTKKLVTVTDEAFVVVSVENCDRRFRYSAECAVDGTKADKKSDDYRARWCDNAAGQKKFGGWTNAGRQRFAKHVMAIAKNRLKDHVPVVEKEMLDVIQGTPEVDLVDGVVDSKAKENDYGGEIGTASFLGMDFTALAQEDGDSDVEELDDNYLPARKPKSAKTSGK